MKLAVIRGSALNPFEMQTYAALQPDVDVIAIGSARADYDTAALGLPTVLLPPYGSSRITKAAERRLGQRLPLSRPTTDFLRGLTRAVAGGRTLHAAETVLPVSDQAARIAARTGVPLVLTCWENIPFRYDDEPLLRERKKRVKAVASRYIAVTPLAAAALVEEGVPESRIRVVPAAVDCSRFRPDVAPSDLRERLGLTASDTLALYVGRLIQEKGVTELVRALALADVPSLHLALMGSGNQGERIRLAASALGVEGRVHLLPAAPYQDLPRHYAAADFTVAPSLSTPYWQEQYGMVLVEAMAAGRAVITTRSGSIPEVVGDSAELVPDYDVPSLAGALRRLTMESDHRSRLGRKARETAERCYDVSVVSRRLLAAYEGLTTDPSGRRGTIRWARGNR